MKGLRESVLTLGVDFWGNGSSHRHYAGIACISRRLLHSGRCRRRYDGRLGNTRGQHLSYAAHNANIAGLTETLQVSSADLQRSERAIHTRGTGQYFNSTARLDL